MTGRRTRASEEDDRDRREAREAARVGMEEGQIDRQTRGNGRKKETEREREKERQEGLTDVQERREKTERRDS